MDHTERAEIMGELTRGIAAKSFPADFIGSDYEGEVTELPAGQEVSMYRELEGVFVMIDGDRLFFNQPAFAKFIFYCAKAGVTEVAVPEARAARKAVKAAPKKAAVKKVVAKPAPKTQKAAAKPAVKKAPAKKAAPATKVAAKKAPAKPAAKKAAAKKAPARKKR